MLFAVAHNTVALSLSVPLSQRWGVFKTPSKCQLDKKVYGTKYTSLSIHTVCILMYRVEVE